MNNLANAPAQLSPVIAKEEAPKKLGRKRRKICVHARNRDFRPCSYDKEFLKKLTEALIDQYPEMESLSINSDGISFNFNIDPVKLLERYSKDNPSKRQ